MSELFINTVLFYILAIIIYLYIVITSVLLISTTARNFKIDIINKLWVSISSVKAKLLKPEALEKAIEYSIKYFFSPINKGLRLIFKYLCITSKFIYKAEEYFVSNVLPELVEPINYTSLVLRKCYAVSQTTIITVTALFFVVFYFILSIF